MKYLVVRRSSFPRLVPAVFSVNARLKNLVTCPIDNYPCVGEDIFSVPRYQKPKPRAWGSNVPEGFRLSLTIYRDCYECACQVASRRSQRKPSLYLTDLLTIIFLQVSLDCVRAFIAGIFCRRSFSFNFGRLKKPLQ